MQLTPQDLVRQHAGQGLPGGIGKLGVAVSGGGDSMALLDVMAWHGRALGFEVAAVTVDHGLRDGAQAEAAFVAEHCAARGIDHDILVWQPHGAGNLQAEARRARYRLIADWAGVRGVDHIALGHTRDDVAETFLMRLARGSGVDGLAEMRREFTHQGRNWLRPLLSLPRDVLRAYLTAEGLSWVDAPSNDDPRFERVRVRQALLVLADLGIGTEEIARSSRNLREARFALADYVLREAFRRVEVLGGDLVIALDPGLPPEIWRRLVLGALGCVGGSDYAPRQSAFAELQQALETGDKHVLNGCVIEIDRARRHWRIAREYAAVSQMTSTTRETWDGRWFLDGPHAPDLHVAALGEAVSSVPDWRATGLARQSLMASPAVWQGDTLIAAPVAGLANGWTATLRPTFAEFLDTH